MASAMPGTAPGLLLSSTLPEPNAPYFPRPQVYTLPLRLTAALKPCPAAMLTMASGNSFRTAAGVDLFAVSGSPEGPALKTDDPQPLSRTPRFTSPCQWQAGIFLLTIRLDGVPCAQGFACEYASQCRAGLQTQDMVG